MEYRCDDLIESLGRLTLRLQYVVRENFSHLTEQQLNWKPREDRWSIAENLQHLNVILDFYLPEIAKRIQKGIAAGYEPKKKFKSSWMGEYMVRSVQLDDTNQLRQKMRSPKAYRPSDAVQNSEIDGHAQIADFVKKQDETLELLKAAKEVSLKKVKIPIAIAQWMKLKLGDMLRFIIYHNERHVVQAQRVHYIESFPALKA